MRILVCFKAVYDMEHITPLELCRLRDGEMELSLFQRKWGNYDEGALENGLRMLEAVKKAGELADLHGVTVEERDPKFGEDLYALGFERITYLQVNCDITYRPEIVAEALGSYVEAQGGYDMILMGKQAGMGENGITPYLLAERLEMPCVSGVYSLEKTHEGIKVVSQTDGKIVERLIKRPTIYIIGEAEHPYLRTATLREKLNAKKREIHHMQMDVGDTVVNSLEYMGMRYEFHQKQCAMIQGDSVEEKADKLWDGLKKWVVK